MFTLDDGAVGIKGGVAPGKNHRKRGGVGEVILGSTAGVVGGGTGEGPTVEGPARSPEGPLGPEGAAGNVAGRGPRTMVMATEEPRPGHTQAMEESRNRMREVAFGS